ncbi:MAG: hypothetical protein ACF8LL_01255, partial [Phycisphaerales bacterium]
YQREIEIEVGLNLAVAREGTPGNMTESRYSLDELSLYAFQMRGDGTRGRGIKTPAVYLSTPAFDMLLVLGSKRRIRRFMARLPDAISSRFRDGSLDSL